MMLPKCQLVIAVFILVSSVLACGQEPLTCATAQSANAPCVDKIDPPNWWVGLPDPMLLLRGQGLDKATFTLRGTGVTLGTVKESPNGHWAFLQLRTEHAVAQSIHIEVRSAAGHLDLRYQLAVRRPASDGFQGFSSRDVLYLIMTDRFADGDPTNDNPPGDTGSLDRSNPHSWHGGDFRGIEQHLDYLQDLGATAVWTTPAYDNSGSPQSYHGYGATDMYAVDPHFGTMADYQHLAAALHARGMKIVLDTVPNHIGPGHPWVHDPPTPDWFHGTLDRHSEAKGDFKSLPDPHASWQEQRDVTEGWFANVLPDLNQENPLVKTYLIQNAVWWIESAGLDGLRLDTFPYIGRAFWRDFHSELHALYPQLTTVGEVFNSDPTITSFFAGGMAHDGIDTGLDTPFDFPTYFALRNLLLKDAPISVLTDVMRQDRLYPHPERLVTFLGNHDTKRFLSESGATPAKLRFGFALLATLRGMPQIYSGDEIAMLGGDDPDNRHDFPGGFPGDTNNAFISGVRTPEQQKMHDAVRALLKLRAAHSALQTGQQQDVQADETTFAFVRTADIHTRCAEGRNDDRVLIVANKSDQPRDLTLELKDTALEGCTQFQDLFQTRTTRATDGTHVQLIVAPQTVAVYQVN
jgi:glycosidase